MSAKIEIPLRLDELTFEQKLKITWIVNSIASHRHDEKMDAFISSKLEEFRLDLDESMHFLLFKDELKEQSVNKNTAPNGTITKEQAEQLETLPGWSWKEN